METPRTASRADALIHVWDASQVFVRLALSRDDAGMVVRSLVVEVLPQIWLSNHDETLLAPWLQDQYPLFSSSYAVFFCGLLKSEIVRGWFERPEDCGLQVFDGSQSISALRVPFTFPEVHDNVTEWHLPSYSQNAVKPIPYPSTLYTFTPRSPHNGHSRDDDRLVSEDGDSIPSFRMTRAELMFGVTDRNQAHQRGDTLAVRVVDARGWLKQVRVTPETLFATLGGTDLLQGCKVVVQGQTVNQRAPVTNHHVSLPLPARITGEVEVALVGKGTVLDSAWFFGTDHAYPYFSRCPHVIVEREDVVGYKPPASAENTSYSPNDVLAKEELGQPRPKVFFSYSHDSEEHNQRVRELAKRLRHEGIECNIDQYVPNPPEGWPRWMMKQINWADYVLVVCTETYCRRFNEQEQPGKGLGVAWESQIITQTLYEQAGNNDKFIPVIFSDEDSVYIPMPLRPPTRYNLADDGKYEELYARLTHQTLIAVPPLGEIRKLPLQDDGTSNQRNAQPPVQAQRFGSEAQLVLGYLVRSFGPEDSMSLDSLAQALGLEVGQSLTDALHELGDLDAIKGYGNARHKYDVFQVTPHAWEYVGANTAGFDVTQDMVVVATAASKYDQVDREELLTETGLSSKRLDIAALLLDEHDYLKLVRPGGRGVMFATVITTYKTRQFVQRHKAL